MAYNIIVQLCALGGIAILTLGIYRLYFSPLAKFPGPKLAALTSAYEAFYDCFKGGGGRYHVEINRMHDKYGPIVRINPWELHIRDPDWNEVYKITRRASKPMWYYQFLGTFGNTFTSVEADVHRMRRDAIQPYFSPAAMARHQPEVERLIGKLMGRLAAFKGKDEAVNLGDVFRCLATDVATAFAFRTPFGHLDSEDFEHAGNMAVRQFGVLGLLNRHSGGRLLKVMALVPPGLARRLSPASLGVAGFFKQLAVVIKNELDSTPKSEDGEEAKTNIIQQILTSNLPPEEKAPWRVARECNSVTLAGTETTGSSLTVITFFLLSQPQKAARLREEIRRQQETLGRPPRYQELKELPYLTGVVNEGLRLDGVSGRLPRYDPKQDMTYKGLVIPKGTVVSTTQNDTNYSPDIFPEPHTFLPERWADEGDRKKLSKYLLPFGRGARSCLGMEIALMEIYLTLGRLFSPDAGFEMELHETDHERDVALFHDYFSPFPKSKRGVRAFVR
ncbi:cytochrome P450 CYP682H1 [Cercophora scortea]|uniref:Cytochrome P450 CYP682H1 n=1 Tax=Cercophora scortea TaxID=314031 RepID=A0AAE0M5J1_9PEZI|nr:cytochrome P450 CYP682H1 [Cercophora scortea]